ncbi:MAG: aspartate/glutamate racemase family protein [Vulcanimicrobiaceae bacterium]
MVEGGKNLYGAPVGILMTQTRFPRIVGDCGNARTWPFPVLFRIIADLTAWRVVRELDPERWLPPFVDAARALERDGAEMITTTCGFLALFQRELADAVRIPVWTSSLLQVPWLAAQFGPASVGVLTFEKASLSEAHLRAAGIDAAMQLAIVGMDEIGGHFHDVIVNDWTELDVDRARSEHLAATRLLLERAPAIRAIVLECANMPPYAQAIAQAARLPVYDLTTLVRWAATGLGA